MKLLLSVSLLLVTFWGVHCGFAMERPEGTPLSYPELVVEYWRKTGLADPGVGGTRGSTPPRADLVCDLDQAMVEEIKSYQDVANAIIELFVTGSFKGKTYDLLANLTDTFGTRMTGTQALEDAIDWVVQRSMEEGFAVHTENVTAPHWIRNEESLTMTSPRVESLRLLGLGTSVGTPAGGVVAEALVVSSFEELAASAAQSAGKIIVYDVPFTSYYDVAQYRVNGAVEAAKVGAVASLVKSVTDFSIATPHTGVQLYEEGVEEIPSAAITLEDAAMLRRFQDRGVSVVLNLTMGAINLPDALTRNTIIDIEGAEDPEEVVVVSGHLDSWDVGTGAMDDAGGCTISWMASMALKELALTPRRTFRTIMFTAEEQNIYGGEAYFLAHGADKDKFQLMMESDFGIFDPYGIAFSGTDEATCIIQEILNLTSIIGTTELLIPGDTPDLQPFELVGVPTGSLNSDTETYLWYHHSEGDTLNVYEPGTLDRVAALWTVVSYVTADISFRLPHAEPVQLN